MRTSRATTAKRCRPAIPAPSALAALDCAMEETQDLNDAGSEDVEVRCHARVSAGRVPGERCLHTCTLLVQDGSRVVYLYAGRGKSGALDDLHQLDLEGNVWTQPKVTGRSPIPPPNPSPSPSPSPIALSLSLSLT